MLADKMQILEQTIFNSTSTKSGGCRLGREIGEAFVTESQEKDLDTLLGDYKTLIERIDSISENASDGFGRAVGRFMADAVMRSMK